MNIRRLTTVLAVVLGGVLSVTVAAPPAGAALAPRLAALVPSTFTELYQTQDVPESSTGSATATCPAGTAAVSVGGLGAEELIGLTPGTTYTSSVASASTGRGQREGFAEAQVTCAPAAQFAGSAIATRQQSVHGPNGEYTATVTCPAGKRAFGGGGYFRTRSGTIRYDAALYLSANTLTADGRGWTVSAVNQSVFGDPDPASILVVNARCAPQSSATRLVEELYPLVPEPGIKRATGYAHCPVGLLPISGGAAITQDGSANASRTQLIASVSVQSGQVGWFGGGNSIGEHAVLHVVTLCG